MKVEKIDALTGNRIVVEESNILSDTAIQIDNDIKKANTIYQKQQRLSELTKDFAQVEAGLIVPDIEDKKVEFRTLLNEVRVLQGKTPRDSA